MRTFKDIRGTWQATETHPLVAGSSWHLTISTHKVSSGYIVTTATVSQHDDHGCTTHRMFTDYSKRIGVATFRATERSIHENHTSKIALAGGLEMLLAEARAHLPEYTAQIAATV